MAKKKKSNAGRRPVTDKKVQVCIYPEESVLNKLGKEEVQRIALAAVYKAYNKL